MSLKIHGGLCKGMSLAIPSSVSFRPTSVILRRKIYDRYQDMSETSFFIDLCAGSGAMGLEAWSRGCKQVYFVEKEKKNFQLLKKNIEQATHHLVDEVASRGLSCFHGDSVAWIKSFLAQIPPHFDAVSAVIFIDPPYNDKMIYTGILKALEEIKFPGDVWVEGDHKLFPLHEIDSKTWEQEKIYEHSTHYLVVLKYRQVEG